MIESTNESNRETQRQLDRLVDGELSDQETRELLLAFDEDPNGWRCCAMAFLEAQAWRGELSQPAALEQPNREEAPAAPVERSSHGEPRRSSGRRSATAYLVTCGLLLVVVVAFGAGDSLKQWVWPDLEERVNPRVAIDRPTDPATELGQEEPNWVTFYVNERPDGVQEVRLPLVDLDEDGERWLRGGETAPQGMRELLRRMGHEVGSTEKFVEPIRLNDGRRVLVPMEQWEIVPISHKSYQ